MQTAPYQEFARTNLGFEFTNIDLLVTAFTHRSYVNEHRKSVSEHNERLEFLGDAVLELVVTDFLFRNYSEAEGILTSWRAALVRTESIGAAGERLEYEKLIRMSRGEKQGSVRARQQILANAFEATTGAIYLDQGYEAAREYITANILSTLPQILEEESWRDPKSYLQEISQARDSFTPVYRVLGEEGPDHEKNFKLGVFVGEKMMGEGEGPSKQIAQQEAARAAIKAYKKRQ
jgi:ribonuclease-3